MTPEQFQIIQDHLTGLSIQMLVTEVLVGVILILVMARRK